MRSAELDRSKTASVMADRQVQRKLVLDDRPSLVLATVESARALLPGHDEDDILMLIEEGFLAYSWNIALSETAAREIRIFPDCLSWYARTFGKGQYTRTEDDVTSDLFQMAKGQPFIKGSTLRLVLNCSATHVINLVETKQLSLQAGTTYERPNTPLITIASVKQFLKSRRL